MKNLVLGKQTIYKSCIERILNGDTKHLFSAFGWTSTPQGSAFWSAVCNSRELSKEAREILTEWLIRENSDG